MSDPGVRFPSDCDSHTSTTEWQSFEDRMRHRRAQRCRVRARVAIDAGLLDEARGALAEARRLETEIAQTARLERRLNAAAAVSAARARRLTPVRRRIPGFIAIAAVPVIATAAALVWQGPSNHGADPGTLPHAVTIEAVEVRADTVHEEATAFAQPDDVRSGADTPESVTRHAPMSEPPTAKTPEPLGSRAPEPPSSRALELPSSRAAEMEDQPVSASPVTRSAPDVASASEIARDEPREINAAAPRDDARVRSVLARYEVAYSSLDAVAARSVWPGVDGRALARAFEGLESQRVSLGQCDVVVLGSSARANCAGTATWTPKVGGGPRTEPRRWTFELAASGGDWQIVRATVRKGAPR
jgi:hypothetical protein